MSDWEIIDAIEEGGVRGIVLERAAELFWVEVDAEPRSSGYRVRAQGLGSVASFAFLDEAALYAASLILSRLPAPLPREPAPSPRTESELRWAYVRSS